MGNTSKDAVADGTNPSDRIETVQAFSQQPIRVEVVDLRELSPSVVLLRLKVRSQDPFSWLPGQHLWLSSAESGEVSVPYSIASSVDSRRPGEFELAISNDGGKGVLSELRPGVSLFVSTPAGSFVWRPSSGNTLLIGIGTGVAPLRAMLQAAVGWPAERAVTLLFGARSEPHVLWKEELVELAISQPRFHFEPTLSQAAAAWTGRRGRVQSHLAELISRDREADVYICGNTSMVADTIGRLIDLGVDAGRILSEAH